MPVLLFTFSFTSNFVLVHTHIFINPLNTLFASVMNIFTGSSCYDLGGRGPRQIIGRAFYSATASTDEINISKVRKVCVNEWKMSVCVLKCIATKQRA